MGKTMRRPYMALRDDDLAAHLALQSVIRVAEELHRRLVGTHSKRSSFAVFRGYVTKTFSCFLLAVKTYFDRRRYEHIPLKLSESRKREKK